MTLQQIVHEALDNAMDNGYFEKGAEFDGVDNEHIANDLLEFDADLENYDVDAILPHVYSWWQKV